MPPPGAVSQLLSQAAGTGGALVGSVFDMIAAGKQKKEAKKQLALGRNHAASQKNDLKEMYSGLLGQAGRQETYQGDNSIYDSMVSEAQKQKVEATQTNPADAIYRENARQGSQNYIENASRGARSGSDVMSIAGMASGMENDQMRAINAESNTRRFSSQDKANSNLLSAIGQQARGDSNERGRAFDSVNQKQNLLLDISKNQGSDTINQNDSLFQAMLGRRGALTDTDAAIFKGVGSMFRSIGGGISSTSESFERMKTLG